MRDRATFVVLAAGDLGRRIQRLANEHAELDADRRRVICGGDFDFSGFAAVVLDARGEVCERLDSVKATAEAWIEDAFLRACRDCRSEPR